MGQAEARNKGPVHLDLPCLWQGPKDLRPSSTAFPAGSWIESATAKAGPGGLLGTWDCGRAGFCGKGLVGTWERTPRQAEQAWGFLHVLDPVLGRSGRAEVES